MDKQIQEAIHIVREGGIVIFPTDTAFGIGCKINDEKSVERLFAIRKRPQTQPTPVLVDTVGMAQNYLLPIQKEVIDKLIEPYWPGALTIILPCKTEKVPSLVRGGGNTLGVRIPNHATARKLIREVAVPILAPSANFHGGQTPYTTGDLDPSLLKMVDYVLLGECTMKKPSTVIDCSSKPWRILRTGAVLLHENNFNN